MHVNLADTFFDVSTLRPVPDNQEVFVNKHDNTSIVFEILEYDASVPDHAAAEYYWNDLCETNNVGKESQHVLRKESLDLKNLVAFTSNATSSSLGGEILNTASTFYIEGEQIAKKSKNSTEDTVVLDILIIRLPRVTSDIIVTSHTPLAYRTSDGKVISENKDLMLQKKNALISSIVASIAVTDWNLFQ